MGVITIDSLPVNKTLYYRGNYTKDLGNDDEYRPQDFLFMLSITLTEDNDDVDHFNVIWDCERPYDNEQQKNAIEERIIDYYYSRVLL